MTAKVRWSYVAALASLFPAMGGAEAKDWEVRRSPAAVAAQAEQALKARPEDDGLAARLVRDMPLGERAALVDRFERAAAERDTVYSVRLAYAQVLLAVRRWESASAQFERAAALGATGAVAPHSGRGRALVGAGDLRGAVTEFRAALELSPPPRETLRLVRELLSAAAVSGDGDAEVAARRAWCRLRPGSRAAKDLAAALDRSGRPGEAADVLAGAARAEGAQGAAIALTEAHYRAAAGDLDRAAAVLAHLRSDVAVGNETLRARIWTESIDVARARGDLDSLQAELARPRGVADWEARARISDEKGDFRDAWQAFDEAIRRVPLDSSLRLRRISVAKRIATSNELVALYEDLFAASGRFSERQQSSSTATEALEGVWSLGRGDVGGRLLDKLILSGGGASETLKGLAGAASRWGDARRAQRIWEALLRRDPRDEVAIIALGELQFQQGHPTLAVQTWRRLLNQGAAAESQARLAEVLVDHDFRDQALGAARAAAKLSPGEVRYRRLAATILERQGRTQDAEAEWESVLTLARGPAALAERRDARARLLALWIRDGSLRVEGKLRELEEKVRRDTANREALLFLVEADLRTGRLDAAIEAMQRALGGRRGDGGPTSEASARNLLPLLGGETARPPDPGRVTRRPRTVPAVGSGARSHDAEDAELILLLVRTLRQAQRLNDALAWLEELSHRAPETARDASLQLADIALAGHADARARDFAEQASANAPDDPRVGVRVAAMQERLGNVDGALVTYRRVVTTSHEPGATMAFAGALARLGRIDEERSLLRAVVRGSSDDDLVGEAGRRAIALEEAGGTLETLETVVATAPDLNAVTGLARRRLLAAILVRLVPQIYRQQGLDLTGVTAKLQRLGQHGLRPMLDLVGAAADAPMDPSIIEVLGMLGRPEAVPHLARVALRDAEFAEASGRARGATALGDDVVAAVVIALGRLGGDAARVTIEAVARRDKPTLRIPVLWALGRVGGGVAVRLATQELARGSTAAGAVACLTLGRSGGTEAALLLIEAAERPLRGLLVRRAALLALALGRHASATKILLKLTDVADADLAGTARAALGWLSTEGGANEGAISAPLPSRDEARGITGTEVDPEALLRRLEGG